MSKAKNDAIVIRSYSDLIDLKPIEELEIDVTAKLTPSLVHKLEKIIVSAVSSKFQMLNIEKQSMIDTIVAQEKKAVGVKNFTQKVKNLENKIEILSKEIATVKIDCILATGFKSNGDRVSSSWLKAEKIDTSNFSRSRYAFDPYSKEKVEMRKYSPDLRKKILDRIEKLEQKILAITNQFDDAERKFDKVKAKLYLSSTYGDALVILNTILGNSDKLLSR